MFVLNQDQCYRISNGSLEIADVVVVDGTVDVNGKIYCEVFGMR
jgi:hypothetical protein